MKKADMLAMLQQEYTQLSAELGQAASREEEALQSLKASRATKAAVMAQMLARNSAIQALTAAEDEAPATSPAKEDA